MFAKFFEQETMMKKFALTLLAAVVVLAATGCNTVHGIGRDIEQGGEAIQRATK